MEEDSSKEKIFQAIAEAIRNHPFSIVLDNVQYMSDGDLTHMLDDFWKVLASGIQAQLETVPQYRFYLFLIYLDQPGKVLPFALPKKRDQIEPPYYLVDFQLPLMEERNVYSWLDSPRVTDLLAEKGCLPASRIIEPGFTNLWGGSENGIHEQIARQFFTLVNAKYKGYLQWLMI